MSEVINSIFGRAHNESAEAGEYVATSVVTPHDTTGSGTVELDVAPVEITPETVDSTETEAGEIDQTEPVTTETRADAADRGNTTVEDGVVAKIVTMLAGKAEGVHNLDDEGISVDVDDDGATIKVSLVLEFGHAVKAVAEQIRISVIEAVEGLLGLDVTAVDVRVTDVHLPDAD